MSQRKLLSRPESLYREVAAKDLGHCVALQGGRDHIGCEAGVIDLIHRARILNQVGSTGRGYAPRPRRGKDLEVSGSDNRTLPVAAQS